MPDQVAVVRVPERDQFTLILRRRDPEELFLNLSTDEAAQLRDQLRQPNGGTVHITLGTLTLLPVQSSRSIHILFADHHGARSAWEVSREDVESLSESLP